MRKTSSTWLVIAAVILIGISTAGAASTGHKRLHGSAKQHQDVPPDQCPAIGTAKSVANQELNTRKNRETSPSDADSDQDVTLEAMLADGEDHDRFNEDQAATIEGYVTDVKQGGHPETANCGNMSKQYTDTHITVALNSGAANTESLVVEVTPRWREKMKQQGIDWSTDTLKAQLVHHKVRFKGWLLFDLDHLGQAINTSPDGARNWRKTVWEIHPITTMEVLQ